MTRWICALVGHETMFPRRQRDAAGAVIQGRLEHECLRCGRVWPATVDLTPSWALMSRLRRQVPWAREQSRRRAS